MSHVRSLRSRRALLLACIAGLLAAPAAAQAEDPIDDYYPLETESGGWLERINWSWEDIQRAHYEDVAYPTIAVIDTGIDDLHPEFADDGVVDPASADCRSGRPVVSNGDLKRVSDLGKGHGTTVAGLAAAPANGVGIVGASPYSALLVLRIVPEGLGGLACSLDYLARLMDHGAIGLLVVNLSLADPRSPSLAVRNGIAKLVRRGALLVAATGNSNANGGTRLRYPARLPHVIAVGDMEEQALLPGPELDLLAPGGNLWTPTVGQVWKPIGPAQTSYATPLVSGAAAAVWGAHPDGSALTAQQIAWLLRSTATRAKSWTQRRGFGTIDVGAALRFRAPQDPRRRRAGAQRLRDRGQPPRRASPPRVLQDVHATRHRRQDGRPRGLVAGPHPRWPQGLPAGRRRRPLERRPGAEGPRVRPHHDDPSAGRVHPQGARRPQLLSARTAGDVVRGLRRHAVRGI